MPLEGLDLGPAVGVVAHGVEDLEQLELLGWIVPEDEEGVNHCEEGLNQCEEGLYILSAKIARGPVSRLRLCKGV